MACNLAFALAAVPPQSHGVAQKWMTSFSSQLPLSYLRTSSMDSDVKSNAGADMPKTRLACVCVCVCQTSASGGNRRTFLERNSLSTTAAMASRSLPKTRCDWNKCPTRTTKAPNPGCTPSMIGLIANTVAWAVQFM